MSLQLPAPPVPSEAEGSPPPTKTGKLIIIKMLCAVVTPAIYALYITGRLAVHLNHFGG